MEETIRGFLSDLPLGPMALCILFGAALLEYIFPPFPGDSAVLVGAFLVATADWNPVAVLVAVNLGSMTGILLDYQFGLYVRHHDARWREKSKFWRKMGRSIDGIMPLFESRPALYLIINRFLPSIRAFFFIAAGIAEVPRWKVLTLGGISALLWCLLLFTVGWWIGNDWERLLFLFHNYQRLVWVVVVVVVILLVRRLLQRNNSTP